MSTQSTQPVKPLVSAFPQIGPAMLVAYQDLNIAGGLQGKEEQQRALGDPSRLPRPWDVTTCTMPHLRREVWQWLEQVVNWLNHEYVWDVATSIPACWPRHPHLVHEIGVIADQRRRAGLHVDSDALEEWHRYCLPAFTDRMRTCLKSHCEEGHQPWPSRGRHSRHISEASTAERTRLFEVDVAVGTRVLSDSPVRPRLGVVDLESGELTDP